VPHHPIDIRSHVWRRAQRVLGVRLDAMGDVIMTGPALRALKESAPGRHITLLTSPSGAEAARLMPCVDEIVVYEAPWMKAGMPTDSSAIDRLTIDDLRAMRFDAAVIFTVYSQNPLPAALLCYLADIPLRCAYCRENPYRLVTDWVRESEPDGCVRHEVRRQLDLVGIIGASTGNEQLSLEIPRFLSDEMDQLLDDHVGENLHRAVVIHPGATAASRRYPWEQFAVVARRLAEDHGCSIIFTGIESERELVDSIRTKMGAPSHSLVGRLDLSRLAALLARMPLLISNNTGTVHVAAAVGTSVVDLYALTNPQHTPWMVPHHVLSHDVPCKYCYKSICPEGHQHCLRLIDPERVVSAAVDLLGLRAMPSFSEGAGLVHARS
jgi:lipopolysaccharide heptosyltransferase II